MYVLKMFYKGYNYIFTDLPDSRSESFFLMGSPFIILAIVLVYLKFVLDVGPKFMSTRPPFKLKSVLIIYNTVQIVVSLLLFIKAFKYTYGLGNYNFLCEPVDTSDAEDAFIIAHGVHLYFEVKVLDLLDTVFFVLRKKNSQISFLHVYHHAGMVILSWAASKFLPGGHSVFIGLINCFVHVVMYSYYLITIIKPNQKHSLWWKKHLTQMQIVQFLIIALHFLSLIIHPYCGYPKFVAFILFPQNLFIFLLFLDFYIKTYVKNKKKQ